MPDPLIELLHDIYSSMEYHEKEKQNPKPDSPPDYSMTERKIAEIIQDVRIPYSEVCMHMRVAGKIRDVLLVEYRKAYIIDENGQLYPPVLPNEAGLRVRGDGFVERVWEE